MHCILCVCLCIRNFNCTVIAFIFFGLCFEVSRACHMPKKADKLRRKTTHKVHKHINPFWHTRAAKFLGVYAFVVYDWCMCVRACVCV